MLVSRDGFVTVALALAVAACGESKSDVSDDDENGGASGSPTGGTSGSSGSSSGGASGSGATGGTGGTAGRGYRPPDNQLMGCTRLCELERAAMCTGETTFEKCIEDCHLGILFEVCTELADDLFACVGAVDAAVCNASGTAVIAECAADGSALNNCIVTNGVTTPPASCAPFCTASATPMCPNTDYQGCSDWCQVVSSAFPVCAPEFETFLECGASTEQGCDADGEAVATLCEIVFGGFLNCLDDDYAWRPGLGIVR